MKILTDRAADLTPQEANDLGISVAPLYIQFPDGEVDSAELTPDQFYERLADMYPEVPTTAQPSAGIFAELYRKMMETGDEILSIHISGGLSGTIDSARLGAKQVAEKGVTVYDTMTLSGGERFQVLAAALASKAGWAKDAILERMENIRANVEVIYTLETLEYLARGGRIGRVQALAGSLLNIKPVIHVAKEDGKYSTLGKARTLKKTMAMMADHLHEMYANTPLWVTVLHGQMNETAEAFAEKLSERLEVAKLEVLRISPILGVHTGPGIVGAAVVPMALMEDLI